MLTIAGGIILAILALALAPLWVPIITWLLVAFVIFVPVAVGAALGGIYFFGGVLITAYLAMKAWA